METRDFVLNPKFKDVLDGNRPQRDQVSPEFAGFFLFALIVISIAAYILSKDILTLSGGPRLLVEHLFKGLLQHIPAVLLVGVCGWVVGSEMWKLRANSKCLRDGRVVPAVVTSLNSSLTQDSYSLSAEFEFSSPTSQRLLKGSQQLQRCDLKGKKLPQRTNGYVLHVSDRTYMLL